MITNFEQLIEKVRGNKTMRLVAAAAQDRDTILALYEAEKMGLIQPILVGEEDVIAKVMKEEGVTFKNARIIPASDIQDSAAKAVQCIKNGEADFIMKGLLDTNIYLKAILNKEHGLPISGLLNHVMVFDPKGFYHKLIITSDGGMVLYPTLDQKVQILKNALKVARALEVEQPKVAVLCAKEKPNPKMPATMDAQAMKELCAQGEFGANVYVEGPIALDLAVSKESARIKKFDSPVAGEMDIAILPNIEAGNIMGKTFTSVFGCESAGVVVGASVPVVMTSRADSDSSKLYAIALGSAMANLKD